MTEGDLVWLGIAAEMRAWAVSIRDVIPEITDERRLDEIEAVLVAIARRLRQIGQDATEAERSRIRAWQRKGQLLAPATPQFYGNQHTDGPSEITRTSLSQAEMDHRAMARLLADRR